MNAKKTERDELARKMIRIASDGASAACNAYELLARPDRKGNAWLLYSNITTAIRVPLEILGSGKHHDLIMKTYDALDEVSKFDRGEENRLFEKLHEIHSDVFEVWTSIQYPDVEVQP